MQQSLSVVLGQMVHLPPVYLTEEGVEDLRRELDHLVNVKRPALAERLRRAIQQGDLSENADYIAAKEEQGFLEGRIQQIELMLRRAKVITLDGPTDRVGLGSRVVLFEVGADEPEEFYIVGPAEANPSQGKISHESPLGRALLGRQVGERVTVEAPGGAIVFQIAQIR